jgi:hypothetical protein
MEIRSTARFQNQSGTNDCFPTCFCNALRYLSVPVTERLLERLESFQNGIEHTTLFESEEKLERYDRSIHKFMAEWNCSDVNDASAPSPHLNIAEWTMSLRASGITLDRRNGPIEQKERIIDALTKDYPVLCEAGLSADAGPRHFVLLVKIRDNTILLHDPLPSNRSAPAGGSKVAFINDPCGANRVIGIDYFFSQEPGFLKPNPNPFQTDHGYMFLVLSRK